MTDPCVHGAEGDERIRTAVPDGTNDVLYEVGLERARQDGKWGGPDHDDNHTIGNWTIWLSFIEEHNVKAFSTDNSEEAYENYRRRMIEVAALAVAAVESLDRVFPAARAAVARAGADQ